MAAPAWATDLWIRMQPYAERAAVWRGYEQELQTLAIYGIGIAVYTALVFSFYNQLSRRRPFHFKMSDRAGWAGRAARLLERLLFPIVSFLYFAVLALSLFVLAKSQTTEGILLLAMAVVVGVRVTVYLSESMSNDLAKLVPLALLGVLLVDPGYLTLDLAWTRLVEATWLTGLLGRYFLLFIALEVVIGGFRASVLRIHAAWRAYQARPRRAKEPAFSVVPSESAVETPPKAP